MSRFRLQRLLDLRRRVEDEKKQLLTLAQHIERRETDTLVRLQGEFVHWGRELESAVLRRIDVERSLRVQMYRDALRGRVARQEEVVKFARARVQERLQAVAESRRERRVLEKLRGRHAQQQQLMERRAQQIQSDEIATQAFVRRERETA